MTLRLGEDVDARQIRLRLAFDADEIAALTAAVDAAQLALDTALGHEHGAEIDERQAAVSDAQAALEAAIPYLNQAIDARVGQVLGLGSELVQVLRVGWHSISVDRGFEGTIRGGHAAGTEFAARPRTSPGGGTGDSSYVHDQQVAAALWEITHGLDKYPAVTVVDSAGDWCVGEVHYIDANRLTVAFGAPFSGAAYLN